MYNPNTVKDERHREYLGIIEKINSKFFKGYNLKQILFNEAYYCMEFDERKVHETVLKNIVLKPCRIDKNINNRDIITFYTKNYRNDHDQYWQKILEDLGEHDEITLIGKYKGKLIKIDWFSIASKLRWYLTFVKEFKEIKNKKDRQYLAAQLVARKWTLEKVKKMKLHAKVAMCFFDSSPDENVIMQYFKSIGTITVTNQHGLCIFQSYEYDRLNQSQILNFKCDYFLGRGHKQKEQFVLAGYDSDRIKVVGCIGASNKEIPIQNTNCMGIYLDCPTNPFSKINNEKMINCAKQIAKMLKMNYLIKCHPQDSIENYQDLIDVNCVGIYGKETTLNETFKNVDICMTHASATYVDVYMYGLKCLKMNSEIRYPIATKEDEFDSVDCAIDLICKWKLKSISEQKQYINSIREEYASPWTEGNINNVLQSFIK